MLPLSLVVAVSIFFVGVAWLHMRSRRKSALRLASANVSMEEKIATTALKAVDRARSEYGLSLDFSMQSMATVEGILSHAFQLYRVNPRLVDSHSTAVLFGAYVAETLRRIDPRYAFVLRGESSDEFFVLQRDGVSIDPVQWCLRCTTTGGDDTQSLPNEIQSLKPELKPARPAKAMGAAAGRRN